MVTVPEVSEGIRAMRGTGYAGGPGGEGSGDHGGATGGATGGGPAGTVPEGPARTARAREPESGSLNSSAGAIGWMRCVLPGVVESDGRTR